MLPKSFWMPPTFCSYEAYADRLIPATAATPVATAAVPAATALAAVDAALPRPPVIFEAMPSTLSDASSFIPTLTKRSRRSN